MRWIIALSFMYIVCLEKECCRAITRNEFWTRFLDMLSCNTRETCTYLTKCQQTGGHSMKTCITGSFIGTCCMEENPVEKVLQLTGLSNTLPSKSDSIKGKSSKAIKQTVQSPQRRTKTIGFLPPYLSINGRHTTPKSTTDNKDCGKQKITIKSRQKRIINGTKTHFGEFPWQVLVKLKKENCGGAILNSQWIITAAHCVHQDEPSDIRVIFGEHDTERWNSYFPIRLSKVKKIVMHPKFDVDTYEYDLGLLQLEKRILYHSHIQPICLPEENEDHNGRYGIATGWGQVYPDGEASPVLRKVSLPIIDHEKCERMFRRAGRNEDLPSFFLCAGYKEGQKDTCNGDSGGPLQVKEDDTYFLVGIMSWGIGCAEPNKPGVYIKVSEFIPWIKDIIKD